jgi:hypothetical protein
VAAWPLAAKNVQLMTEARFSNSRTARRRNRQARTATMERTWFKHAENTVAVNLKL